MSRKIIKIKGWCDTCEYAEHLQDQPPCYDCCCWPLDRDTNRPVNYESNARHKNGGN